MARILVVESDGGVRAFVTRVLRDAQHQVWSAESLAAAAASSSNGERDLVIMSVPAAADNELRRLVAEAKTRWRAPVLAICGCVTAERNIVEYESFVVLGKPFALHDLVDGVRVALERNPPEQSLVHEAVVQQNVAPG